MKCCRLCVCLLTAIILFASTHGYCLAGNGPTRMSLEATTLRTRTFGPVALRIRLDYNQPQVCEGKLQLKVYDEFPRPELLQFELTLDSLVLSGSDLELQTILPPMPPSSQESWAIMATFVNSDGEEFPLSADPKTEAQGLPPTPFEILTSRPEQRRTLIASVTGRFDTSGRSPLRRWLDGNLGLEAFNPFREDRIDGRRFADRNLYNRGSVHIQDFTVGVKAVDLATDPLLWCTYDLVVLADGALSRVSAPQADALKKWVAAGGSICIVPDGTLVGKDLSLLTELAGKAEWKQLIATDAEGRFGFSDASDFKRPLLARYGYGRVALVPPDYAADEEPSNAERGRLVAWLWKVRADSPISEGKPWRDPASSNSGPDYRYGNDPRTVSPRSSETVARLTTHLMPADVELVPISVIALILAGFVITVGPVDYFLLGWLRLRRLTWILFPVNALLFTWLTMWTAEYYMGSNGTGNSVEIYDLLPDGSIARGHELALTFTGSRQTREEQVKSGFRVPVITLGTGFAAIRNADSGDLQPPRMQGRFPQDWTYSFDIAQWSPRVMRSFRIDCADVTPPGVTWKIPEGTRVHAREGTADATEIRQQLTELAEQLNRQEGGEWSAMLWTVWSLHRSEQSARRRTPGRQTYDPYTGQPITPQSADQLIASLTTASNDGGWGHLVTVMSPDGSGQCEDLSIADPSVPGQGDTVLILVQKTEDGNYRVFRKIDY